MLKYLGIICKSFEVSTHSIEYKTFLCPKILRKCFSVACYSSFSVMGCCILKRRQLLLPSYYTMVKGNSSLAELSKLIDGAAYQSFLVNVSIKVLLDWWKEYSRALEKVYKQQLNRKRFEIYQTISCFWALSLNNIKKFDAKSVKLTASIEVIIESTFIKFLPRLHL